MLINGDMYKFNSPEVHSSRGRRGTEQKEWLYTSWERFTTAESFQSSNGRRYTAIPLHFIEQLDSFMNSEGKVSDDDDLGVS